MHYFYLNLAFDADGPYYFMPQWMTGCLRRGDHSGIKQQVDPAMIPSLLLQLIVSKEITAAVADPDKIEIRAI